jgi:gas vesicle protein
LLNGCPYRFKKILEDECMAELKDVLKEQTDSMDNLTKAWSESFKNLKSTVDDRKQFVKKSGGDIKDSIEKLRQSMDKFLSVIDEQKLSLVCSHVSTITECLVKINDLEKTGALQKLAFLINGEKTANK